MEEGFILGFRNLFFFFFDSMVLKLQKKWFWFEFYWTSAFNIYKGKNLKVVVKNSMG